MNRHLNEIYYRALLEKDSSYEGTFFACVKTTGVFCRPTCTARKPKKENVEFFSNTKEAILKGYRPCKVCSPLEKSGETPEYIKDILKELRTNPSLKFKDQDLLKKGIAPVGIRRWFLKNHGSTFHAWQRMSRINSAFKKIQNGESITATAFDSGFESLSGFGDSFKSVFGTSPKNSSALQIIDLTRLETPLGTMLACATEQGLCSLEFSDRKILATQFKFLAKQLKATILQGENKHLDLLKQQLAEYFDGKRKEFSLKLLTKGTDFQKAVWKALQNIPYGSTCSYLQHAIALQSPCKCKRYE